MWRLGSSHCQTLNNDDSVNHVDEHKEGGVTFAVLGNNNVHKDAC